jgi:hypothetical protein
MLFFLWFFLLLGSGRFMFDILSVTGATAATGQGLGRLGACSEPRSFGGIVGILKLPPTQ